MATTKMNMMNELLKEDNVPESILLNLKRSVKSENDVRMRLQQIAPTLFEPQSIHVKHEVAWPTGDKIINGIYGLFGNQEPDLTSEYQSIVGEEPGFLDYLMDGNTLLILLMASIVMYKTRGSEETRQFLIIITAITATSIFFQGRINSFVSDLIDLFLAVDNDREKHLDEEIFPQADLDTNLISRVLLSSMSLVSGYKAKSSLVEAFLSATKVTDTQSSNVASGLMFFAMKSKDFFIKMDREDLAKYFEIESVSDDRVSKLQIRVISFIAAFNSGNPDSMLHSLEVYKTLYDDCNSIEKTLTKGSFDHRVLMDCTTKLISVYQKIEELNLSLSGDRIEPVGIILKGDPGCLKSVLSKRLATVLVHKTLPEEWKPAFKQSPKDFYYAIPNDQFWDNYTNKAWVAFYDDIFQRRDAVADSDSDALKIIKMINSQAYTLKMANVSLKNNVFFRSAFVVANTNLKDFTHIQSVTNVEAVRRRFHYEVDVTVNPKYRQQGSSKTDFSRLEKENNSETARIPNDFWILNVTRHRGDSSVNLGVKTLQELIVLCESKYIDHKRNFYVNRKCEEDLLQSLIDDCQVVPDDLIMEECEQMPGTYFPQGEFDSSNYRSRLKEYITEGPLDHMHLDMAIFRTLNSLNRVDLYKYDRWRTIDSIILNEEDAQLLWENRSKIKNFIKVFYTIVKQRISNNIDPITGKTDWLGKVATKAAHCWDYLKSLFVKFYDFFCDHKIMVILTVVGSGLALKGLYQFISSFFSQLGFTSQSVDIKTMGRHRIKGKQLKLSALKPIIINAQPEGNVLPEFDLSILPKFTSLDFGDRNNQNDVIAKVFNKSLFIMYIVKHNETMIDCETSRLGHALNIKGQLFLIPMHFIFLGDAFKSTSNYCGATVIFVTTNGRNKFSLSLEEMLISFKTTDEAADRDLCLVKLQCAQALSVGCKSSFLTNADYEHLSRTTSFKTLIIGSQRASLEDHAVKIRSHYTQTTINKGAIEISAVWTKEQSSYLLTDNLMYSADTSKGDCGSLIIPTGGNYENRVLIGIHVAGGHKLGFGVAITQEQLDHLIEHTFPDEFSFLEETIPEYCIPIDQKLEPQSDLQPLYKLTPDYIPGEVFKSQIRKSKLYGKLPHPYNRVMTFPAKLKPFYTPDGSMIDPLQKAFNKYGKTAPDIDYGLVSRAVSSYENLIIAHSKTKPEFRNIIPLKKALHSFDNINSISSSTSAGFPMSMSKTNNLKKNYYKACEYNNIDQIEVNYQRIATLVEFNLDLYRERKRPLFCYKQCGKDETREWFKVLEGKTRLFSACPFILLVMFRMYFGAFINEFVSANLMVGSAVGINPYSEDWNNLANLLLKFSSSKDEPTVAAGDQGQFDTRQWPIIHNAILDMINRYYGDQPEDNKIRMCLFKEITNSRHIFRGEVYEWDTGLPSGNPMTAIINTIYNNIVFRISWGLSGLDISTFNKNCYLIVLGDDNVFSVRSMYRETFNEVTLPLYMDQIGMEYTTELKGSAVYPFRKLKDVEFLKRSFSFDKTRNKWIAPLRESAIAEMLNWTKKGNEGDQISVDNICFALREFSLHGEKVFEHWRKNLVDIKQRVLPEIDAHGELPLNFKDTYESVLDLEYFF